MESLPVAPGVRRITTPLPFRPRSVHAYLVERGGGGWMLVDGGGNTPEAWAVLDGAVRARIGQWQRLSLHLVTHMHVDHVGLAGQVRRESGAPLAMGRLDAERAAHAAAHPEEEAAYRSDLLRECGAEPALIEWAVEGAAGGNPLSSFVPCDYPLPEPRSPILGFEGWEAVWTPGHTAGHVALFRAADRVLIGGDAVLPRVSPTIGVNRQREDPVGDYLEALDRVDSLRPAVILPGHGEPLTDPADRIAELRTEVAAETERVALLLSSAPATAAELARLRYAGRDLPRGQQMQALRETLAHLHHLARSGRARSAAAAGVVRFWHV